MEETPEIVYLELQRVGRRLNRQYILIAFIFLVYALAAAGTFLSMSWLQGEALRNPMYEYEERQQEMSRRSRTMHKEYNKRLQAFSSASMLSELSKQEDPQQALIRHLIKTERSYQDYILYTSRAVTDLSRLVGGIDEWFYYESDKLKTLVSKSRKRQKSLRGLLKAVKKKQQKESEARESINTDS